MTSEESNGFALRWSDLWWIFATPLYHMLATIRHEGSHLLVGLAQGGHLIDFSVLPSRRGWGHVDFEGGTVTWVMTAAPYVCDVLTFVFGYLWLFRIPARRHVLFVNVFTIALLSSFIASLNNYRGAFASYDGGDVGHLVRVLGPVPVHTFFVAVFALFALGTFRVLRRTPVALHRG